MEHNRKHKLLMIIALVVGIASLSIGFAAFSATLNISSSASVTPNSDSFSVKFSTNKNSLVVDEVVPSSISSGITASNGIIKNNYNPTITNLSANFNNPGQYVEYTFYARNEGEYTAYLNNINFIGNKTCTGDTETTDSLVQSACDDITITAVIGETTYSETTPITGHALTSSTGEQIKVRLEYDINGDYVDGDFSIIFPDITLVYSTIDDSSIQPTVPKKLNIESGNLNDPGSIVSIGNEKFYVIGQENGNVKLLSMYNLHVGYVVEGQDSDENLIISTISSPTGKQYKSAIGAKIDENEEPVFPWIGTVAFSNTGTAYLGSIVESYVNNYATYLEDLGINIAEARLISKEELENLGCDFSGETCSNAPSWLYATSYWVEPHDTYSAVAVCNDSTFNSAEYSADYILGVRPVIEISLSEF